MTVTITRNPNLTKARAMVHFDHEIKNSFGDSWWTGLAPLDCPGFDKERQCLSALPLLNLEICSRQDVLDYFNNSWTLTELLFQSLKTEAAYKRPPYHGLRHPLIFYYGHPAVLYYNKLRVAGVFKDPINLYLEKVLETGVDEMSWDDMSKNEMQWPSVSEVRAYRKIVYDQVVQLIMNHPDLDRPGKKTKLQNSFWWALWMGLEHEKIHLETSSVLIRELPIEYVETPKYWAPLHPSSQERAPKNKWNIKKGQEVLLGKPEDFPSYGWDNEYGKRVCSISDFQYTEFQITNAEFFEFVKSGSYIEDSYWSPEGLEWRKYRNTRRPTFWVSTGPEGANEYELRTLFEIIPMPWSWPVEVNFHEAMAYCRWKQELDKTQLVYRLLTEAEYVSLLDLKESDPVLQIQHYGETKGTPLSLRANFNMQWSSPMAVNAEIMGNTWHWLLDQFNPLDNFKTHAYYDDFSTPCFDGRHQMIAGGSFISCGDEASRWSRFHFRPHFYQHSGFRMSATLNGSSDNASVRLNKSETYVHPRRTHILDQMQNENWWKKIEQPLEMNPNELEHILKQTQNEVINFIKKYSQLSAMGSAHDPKTNSIKKDFLVPYQMTRNFPEAPSEYGDLLKFIFNDLAPMSQLPGHPGFAAYVAGSDNALSNTAQLVAQTINPYTAHFMMAPGLVTLEQEVIKWFLNMTGMNESATGYLTSGSSLATMNALMAARNKHIKGHDFSRATGYVSDQTHHSVLKAWVMLGLKKENLRVIKSKNHKMDTSVLASTVAEDKLQGLSPFFLVATLGSTNCGSVDDVLSLSDLARKVGLWLHGDAAYGGFFMLTQKGKKLLQGISECDSLCLDPHKSLSLPYGTGCLLVKDASTLKFDYGDDDPYMPPHSKGGVEDYAEITPELSRDYRGLRVWLPIKTLGIAPFALNLEEKLKLIEFVEVELRSINDLEITSPAELSILTFKHKKGEQATKDLLAKINSAGDLFLSSTRLEGEFVIRICLLGHRMHYERVERFMRELKTMASQC